MGHILNLESGDTTETLTQKLDMVPLRMLRNLYQTINSMGLEELLKLPLVPDNTSTVIEKQPLSPKIMTATPTEVAKRNQGRSIKLWSAEDDATLTKFYKKIPCKDLAKKLGRTEMAVRNRALVLKKRKDGSKKKS